MDLRLAKTQRSFCRPRTERSWCGGPFVEANVGRDLSQGPTFPAREAIPRPALMKLTSLGRRRAAHRQL